ncbi:UNVERIFIED_CONTAM: hypothetical protein Sradi_1652900 [Sesamum radiatum]|uniref:N-acetyltransferase domain-containing protein n=1 Tax=Sesamum radiatum TaxID=300843 RepID=A0AAW2UDS1_SESRA
MGHLHFQRSRHRIRGGQRNSPPMAQSHMRLGAGRGVNIRQSFSRDGQMPGRAGVCCGVGLLGKRDRDPGGKNGGKRCICGVGELERLEAVVAVQNTASQRVLEKAGFMREGVLRKYFLLKGRPTDAVIFSLLSTDPQVNFFMDA